MGDIRVSCYLRDDIGPYCEQEFVGLCPLCYLRTLRTPFNGTLFVLFLWRGIKIFNKKACGGKCDIILSYCVAVVIYAGFGMNYVGNLNCLIRAISGDVKKNKELKTMIISRTTV